MKQFVVGRKNTRTILSEIDFTKNEWLWFHCASLGEYEQAVPVIEAFKNDFKILVSFFSPSGYEQKKNHKLIDCAIYLPIDTPNNAKLLVKTILPKAALFIKYEFWRNYFEQLNSSHIPIYMISAAFRPEQALFKWYGGFLKETLNYVSHFFVQNKKSVDLLKLNGFNNVSLSGDTRFDRVYQQLSMDNHLEFIADFKKDRITVVLGSTWPDCEDIFIETINNSADNVCFIVAPHEIKTEKISTLVSKLKVATSIYSKGIHNDDKVLIIDAIGFLTRIYSYADIAYVGGAVGTTGLHNILEAAVFGIPIITGINTEKFPEAQELEVFGGLTKIHDKHSFKSNLHALITHTNQRNSMGHLAKKYVYDRVGATKIITKFIGSEFYNNKNNSKK